MKYCIRKYITLAPAAHTMEKPERSAPMVRRLPAVLLFLALMLAAAGCRALGQAVFVCRPAVPVAPVHSMEETSRPQGSMSAPRSAFLSCHTLSGVQSNPSGALSTPLQMVTLAPAASTVPTGKK